ncbi:MAG TPA: DUF86 domain-containing protein [Nitrospirae bacterium]|nr:DUF86 domain-containing protein [Nitrospirota bacterium]
MREDDHIRLWHMLDAAREILIFSEGKSRQDLDTNRMLALAIVKSIEIIGEAASKVTQETRSAFIGLPWPGIIATRNRLIHTYYDIDLDRVWDTIQVDLPQLVKALEKVTKSNS